MRPPSPGVYCSGRWQHLADEPNAPVALTSHPKNSETGLFQGRVQSRAQAESQDQAGVGGIDDSVIPESVRTKETHGSIDRRTAHYVPETAVDNGPR